MKTIAYNSPMSFSIPDSEKEVAKKAEKYFTHLKGLIDKAVKHFNIIYEPFKENSNIPTEETIKNRVALREFREQVKDNFDLIKKIALESFRIMNHFSSDTETYDIMNAFTDQLDGLEESVNDLLKVFSNLSSEEFVANIIKNIDVVKNQCEQLENLINDRILNHIDTNILAKNWVSNVSDQFNTKIDDKVPMIVQLYKERHDAVENVTKKI